MTVSPDWPIAHPWSSPRPEVTKRKYLAVSGTIGAGKSSLVEFLCHRYNLQPYFEPNDENPYLADFYDDMKGYAFRSQVYFLTAKYRLHRQIDQCDHNVIQDRTIWEDAEIFAENLYRGHLMDERDYLSYRALYESIRDVLRPPDLMIYLYCDVRTVKRRIRQRGRRMEQDIPAEYLRQLQKLYDAWIGRYSQSPIVTFRTDKMDYITDLVDRHDIMTTIERFM